MYTINRWSRWFSNLKNCKETDFIIVWDFNFQNVEQRIRKLRNMLVEMFQTFRGIFHICDWMRYMLQHCVNQSEVLKNIILSIYYLVFLLPTLNLFKQECIVCCITSFYYLVCQHCGHEAKYNAKPNCGSTLYLVSTS